MAQRRKVVKRSRSGLPTSTGGRAQATRQPALLCFLLILSVGLACTSAFGQQAHDTRWGPEAGQRGPAQPARPSRRFLPAPTFQYFEPNVGQAEDPAAFVYRGATYDGVIRAGVLVLRLKSGNTVTPLLRLEFGSQPLLATVTPSEILPGVSNYFRPKELGGFRVGIPHFASVKSGAVSPGIDVVFHAREGAIEFETRVSPHADPSEFVVRFKNADSIALNRDGTATIKSGGEGVRLSPPDAYQIIEGTKKLVSSAWRLCGALSLCFSVGKYDRDAELLTPA